MASVEYLKILMIPFLLGGCSLQCEISSHPVSPDMSMKVWNGKCMGPDDEGKVVYWGGRTGSTYVCRDNGPPNHWWFVQIPNSDRRIP